MSKNNNCDTLHIYISTKRFLMHTNFRGSDRHKIPVQQINETLLKN